MSKMKKMNNFSINLIKVPVQNIKKEANVEYRSYVSVGPTSFFQLLKR